MKDDLVILILMMITVPLIGELKFFPFHDTFRISFGSPIFLFFLLWIRKLPLILYGFFVGVSVVVFRIGLDWFMLGSFQLSSDFIFHISALLYYLTFSCIFYFGKTNRLYNKPFLFGSACTLIDIFSSLIELLLRNYILKTYITFSAFGLIIIISIIRSFFALSFFYIIKLKEVRLSELQQREQNENMLLLTSNLYEESIQLKKCLQNSENITRQCYDLYEQLQNNCCELKKDELAQRLLSIAGEVHEIKKDNQRIYSGLSKMISSKSSTDYMYIFEIMNIIIKSNKKYADSLNKHVQFKLNINDIFPKLHVYTILSILNNLVSNSVEAIKNEGSIEIYIIKINDFIEFKVCDEGCGVPKKKKDLIFKPGYTTKYDNSGKPSTGMGLPYVKEITIKLNGSVSMQNNNENTKTFFIVKLPINNLTNPL